MAQHFAKLSKDAADPSNEVLGVHVVADKDCEKNGSIDEETGRAFLEKVHNWPFWKQTDPDTQGNTHTGGGTPLGKNYAPKGGTYNASIEGFTTTNPFPGQWVLNSNTGLYQAPTSSGDPLYPFLDYPSTRLVLEDQDDLYVWTEEANAWVLQGTPR